MKKSKIKYNLAQLAFLRNMRRVNTLELARGVGKSTILGKVLVDLAYAMPRSKGIIAGETFLAMQTRTLPSTINGLAMHGFYKDVHYVINQRPPKKWNWPEPYHAPLSYRYCIYFYTGMVAQLVSMDKNSGSARGTNSDFIIADEAALLDKAKLNTDVLGTNRGTLLREFEHCPLHLLEVYASTTPLTASGRWLFDNELLAQEQPDEYFYLRAKSDINKANLPDSWFKRMEEDLEPWMYNAEILNIRLRAIMNGFYPLLGKQHYYTDFEYEYLEKLGINPDVKLLNCNGDNDLVSNQPLIGGVDYGSRINCMVTAQKHPGEIRLLKDFNVKSPKIADDLVDEVCLYYKPKINKEIFLWYDSNGNHRQANSKYTLAQETRNRFASHGWTCHLMTKGGKNPYHHDKFILYNKILAEDQYGLPRLRINKVNCKNTIISMENAPAKNPKGEILKDKKSERSKTILAEHATDHSDAVDNIIWGECSGKLRATPLILPPNYMSG